MQELENKFSKYTEIPQFEFISERSDIKIINGYPKIHEKNFPKKLEDKLFSVIGRKQSDKNCEIKIIEISDNCEIKIQKGNSHFLFLIKNSEAKINLFSNNSKNENISIECFAENSKVFFFDVSAGKDICHFNKVFHASNSEINQINFYSNELLTIGRNNNILLEGSNSNEITLILGTGNSKYDIFSTVTNSEKNTSGKMLTKSVMKDNSESIIWGMINIEENSINSNSYQSAHSILFDKNAKSKIIPQLEIKNNDVRATHGATVSEIDAEKIFYMQSKGMKKLEAKKMLCLGFLEDPIKDFKDKMTILDIIEKRWN